jgi:hypothetical protein
MQTYSYEVEIVLGAARSKEALEAACQARGQEGYRLVHTEPIVAPSGMTDSPPPTSMTVGVILFFEKAE